jgi:hypothetical protein
VSLKKNVCEVSDFSSEVIVVSVCLAMGTQTVDSDILPGKVGCRVVFQKKEVLVDEVQS